MGYALGIDLGTTFTAAALARDSGVVEAVTLGERSVSIPSVVLLRDDGEVLVGEAADRRALSEPGRVAREFKRRLGDPVPMIVGSTPYGAETLLALLLKSVIERVTAQEGSPPDRIALTHPASWGAFKIDLLEQAVRQAGLQDVTLLSEPVAAAVQYASQERLEDGDIVAVYDFGGGTFDAALLRRSGRGFELLGNPEGLERLGGIDIDQAILVHVDQALGGQLGELDPTEPGVAASLSRLAAECRSAKEALSSDTDAVVAVALPGLQTEVRVTRGELEAMLRPRLSETIAALRRAIASAGVAIEDVNRVLLVGGTARIPVVSQVVREELGRPVAVDANPKLVVCLGAARWAAGDAPSTAPVAPAPTIVAARPTEPTAAGEPSTERLTPIVVAATPAAPSGKAGSKTPLLIGAGVAAVIVVVIAALALGGGGGGDDSSATPEQERRTTTTAEPDSAETTTAPKTTTTTAVASAAASGPTKVVTDDTGTFAIEVPERFSTDTAFRNLGGVNVAHISGADELDAYLRGDWTATGATVLVGDRAENGSIEEILNAFNPADTCATHSSRDSYANALGSGLVQHFEGCGAGGAASQVLAALDLPNYGAVVLIGAVGRGNAAAQQLFDAVSDSISPLTS